MVVTTGGVGPGKYDLVAETFKRLGVTILYNSLKVRPGKSTLFGIKSQTLFFGLPGPPPAVRLLFNELLRPALLKAQGFNKTLPQAIRATITEPLTISQPGTLSLKGAVLSSLKGTFIIRPARKTEAINAVILIPPHRRYIQKGELVTVHQARQLFQD